MLMQAATMIFMFGHMLSFSLFNIGEQAGNLLLLYLYSEMGSSVAH